MKKSNFWLLTLCVLLGTASVSGLSPLLRVALAANAVVVLMDVVRTIHSFRASRR